MFGIVSAVPDHITISIRQFWKHFTNILNSKSYELDEIHTDFIRIYGYSCRSLFEICMEYYTQQEEINSICTTPLHHTSFYKIINKYIALPNIEYIEYDKSLQALKVKDHISSKLIIITHIFGQDFKLDKIKTQSNPQSNPILLEDRVQGGSQNKDFSCDDVDIALYSMGMDKRPNALGGGFVNIRNNDKNKKLIEYIKTRLYELPKETRYDRFKDLIKKIPTFLIYNYNFFTSPLILGLSITKYIYPPLNTTTLTSSYRQTNPGFKHDNYMKRPSTPLLKSMKKTIHKHIDIEGVQAIKNNNYMGSMSKEMQQLFYPWYKDKDLLTNYNTIRLDEEYIDDFIQMCTDRNICVIRNPTYKTLSEKYKNIQDSLIYLPSLNSLTNKEMAILVELLKEFKDRNR